MDSQWRSVHLSNTVIEVPQILNFGREWRASSWNRRDTTYPTEHDVGHAHLYESLTKESRRLFTTSHAFPRCNIHHPAELDFE